MLTKLTADHVIGYNGKSHVLWPHAEVVFSDDVIVHVGRGFAGTVDRTVDYGNAVIGPGFIDLDALGDLDSTILGFDNGPEWTIGRVWSESYLRDGPQECFTFDEQIFKYRYAFSQLIRNGITTAMPITSMLYRAWAESYEEFAEVAAVAGAMGIRAYLGPCYMSGLTYVSEDGRFHQHFNEAKGLAGLADAARFVGDFDGSFNGRIRGFLAPDRIETQLPSVLERSAAINAELKVPFRLHCCQSAYEYETVLRLRGCSPLQWLNRLGLLNERAVLPHGIYLSGHPSVGMKGNHDFELLKNSGASIVHCPVVFARDGEGLNSFSKYHQAGINIAMGTDTFPPDIVENMRHGLNICHMMDGERIATAADFFNAATLGGAKALGRTDIGRLAPGAKADITVFDLSGFHMGQRLDPIKTMVLSGSGRDFVASYVDGIAIMEQGKVRGVDAATLDRQAQAQFAKVMATHQHRAVRKAPLDQMFKPSFPVVAE